MHAPTRATQLRALQALIDAGGPMTTTEVAHAVWPDTGRRRRGFTKSALQALERRRVVVRRPDGRWLTSARLDELIAEQRAAMTYFNHDGRLVLATSSDGGGRWTKVGEVG